MIAIESIPGFRLWAGAERRSPARLQRDSVSQRRFGFDLGLTDDDETVLWAEAETEAAVAALERALLDNDSDALEAWWAAHPDPEEREAFLDLMAAYRAKK